MPTALDAIIKELSEADRLERQEILIDFVKKLPPLPDRLASHKDRSHRVEECVSDVYLFVEVEGDRVSLFADAPIEAPTVRSFVAILVEGLDGSTVQDVLSVPNDLMERSRLVENLGMQRLNGLTGVLRRLKTEVTKAAASVARVRAPSADDSTGQEILPDTRS